jgi:branched-chain amino acid transport system permease protein
LNILPQLLINALIAGSIYAIASAGLSLAYGLLRVLNFAHGHLMMVGVYVFYFLTVEQQLGIVPAAVATAAASVVLGAATYRCAIAPFAKQSFLLTLVATMAVAQFMESVVSMIFGVNVKSLSPGSAAESIEINLSHLFSAHDAGADPSNDVSIYITPIQITIILSAIVLMVGVSLLVHRSSIGRKIRALAQHPHGAQSVGVNENAICYGVFIFGTLLACYAGVLIGFETNLQPTMAASYTIKAFAVMVLGGLGNLWGTFLGSYILGLVENLSIVVSVGGYSLPSGYKDAFSFLIILLLLLFRPEGLFGSRRRTV